MADHSHGLQPSVQPNEAGSAMMGTTGQPVAPVKPLLQGLSHRWSRGRGFLRSHGGDELISFRVQVAASWWRWILSRLWTVHTSCHSLDVASSPRIENRRNPRLALMLPNTVSTVVLRLA
jgi:hypothetical protein